MTRSLTVLIVDDSAPMRAILAAIVSAEGHRVFLADGVTAAVEILDVQQPDVILTDYRMPGQTGLDFVRRIRSRAALDDTPVFVISSETAPEKRSRMACAGANAWIAKPVIPATLLAAIGAVSACPPLPRSARMEPRDQPALRA